MRGITTQKSKIRQMIFTEVARLGYEGGGAEALDELPYKIIPGEIATYRESIFLERAIVGERLRVAMGLSFRPLTEHAPISKGVDESMIAEKYYEPPLVEIIRFACHACPEKRVYVTDGCQGCLEHPCKEVCPKNAIDIIDGKSRIDESKCIKCGKCMEVCQYSAIIRQERPCVKACGMNAIESDEYGRAKINQDKCVSCGQCLVTCPFGAIVDKSQIYQTIKATKEDAPVIAILAPAVAGQFAKYVGPEKIESLFKELGFSEIAEVAIGADLCTIEEAKDFMKEVPDEIPFMGTSCCPAWSMMIKKEFPAQAKCISMALTPMVLTARMIKKANPDAKICFVGPCDAKKLEASRRTIKSYVDFVLTFEEVEGMILAKNIDFDALEAGEPLAQASADGRGFAQGGGVAQAVVNYIKQVDPEREVKVVAAEGLADCKKMMKLAKAGKYNGYLLEGMACKGGCIAGAGTISSLKTAQKDLATDMKAAPFERCADTDYGDIIPELENFKLEKSNKADKQVD